MLGYAPPQGSSSKPQSHPFKLSDEGPRLFRFPHPLLPNIVEEKSRSTCQKYEKTYSHIATKTIFSANVMALSAAVRVYNLKLSFYCSIFTFARTVQYLFFHQGNYGYNFIISVGHISMP